MTYDINKAEHEAKNDITRLVIQARVDIDKHFEKINYEMRLARSNHIIANYIMSLDFDSQYFYYYRNASNRVRALPCVTGMLQMIKLLKLIRKFSCIK